MSFMLTESATVVQDTRTEDMEVVNDTATPCTEKESALFNVSTDVAELVGKYTACRVMASYHVRLWTCIKNRHSLSYRKVHVHLN